MRRLIVVAALLFGCLTAVAPVATAASATHATKLNQLVSGPGNQLPQSYGDPNRTCPVVQFGGGPIDRHFTYTTEPGGVGTIETAGCVGPHSPGGTVFGDSGTFTLTDPNGDKLFGTYGYGGGGIPAFGTPSGTFTVTVGTKKLRKVTGTIRLTTVYNYSNSPFPLDFTFTGDLQRCHDHDCDSVSPE
jgi:hypothetical protein